MPMESITLRARQCMCIHALLPYETDANIRGPPYVPKTKHNEKKHQASCIDRRHHEIRPSSSSSSSACASQLIDCSSARAGPMRSTRAVRWISFAPELTSATTHTVNSFVFVYGKRTHRSRCSQRSTIAPNTKIFRFWYLFNKIFLVCCVRAGRRRVFCIACCVHSVFFSTLKQKVQTDQLEFFLACAAACCMRVRECEFCV